VIIVENNSVPADTRVWAECRTLRAAGWQVSVICPRGQRHDTLSFEQLDGVSIHRFNVTPSAGGAFGYGREYAAALMRIRQLLRAVIRERMPDVIQACNPPDFLLLTALAPRRKGVATIFDHHDLSPELFEVKFPGRRVFSLAMQWTERLGFACADVVISTNGSFAAIAVQRGHKNPDDVFVVRNGPGLDMFRPVTPDPALRSGAEYLIGYVGLMGDQDGVDVAVEALGLLRDQRNDWHAIFVGDGDALPRARELAAQLGLEDRITFAGFIRDRATLLQIISTCDVCLSPEPRNALNESSTLIKVAEYMAAGRPVVAFDLNETRETAGDTAAYAEEDTPAAFAAAVADLLDDPDRRAAMGLRARERAEASLTWQRSEDALLRAYERAIERARTRSHRD
jgi:glycosyltransferase involved in cell wall biosynthesis